MILRNEAWSHVLRAATTEIWLTGDLRPKAGIPEDSYWRAIDRLGDPQGAD